MCSLSPRGPSGPQCPLPHMPPINGGEPGSEAGWRGQEPREVIEAIPCFLRTEVSCSGSGRDRAGHLPLHKWVSRKGGFLKAGEGERGGMGGRRHLLLRGAFVAPAALGVGFTARKAAGTLSPLPQAPLSGRPFIPHSRPEPPCAPSLDLLPSPSPRLPAPPDLSGCPCRTGGCPHSCCRLASRRSGPVSHRECLLWLQLPLQAVDPNSGPPPPRPPLPGRGLRRRGWEALCKTARRHCSPT